MKTPQFVTALYLGLEDTIFNGNSFGLYDRYRQSLKSLAAGGYSIVCYVSKTQYDELKEYFSDTPNLKLELYELDTYPDHQKINTIKQSNPKYNQDPSWRSRCVEIMWGKFLWLQNNLSKLNDGESLFWIDAGIFHGGLVSNTFRSKSSKNFYDFDLITQKRNLYDDLVKFAGDKILNISSERVNHGYDDYQQVFQERPDFLLL